MLEVVGDSREWEGKGVWLQCYKSSSLPGERSSGDDGDDDDDDAGDDKEDDGEGDDIERRII